MKLKKLWAGVTAAALTVGLVAVTPAFTSAADSSHVTGAPYIIADAHGRFYGFSIREAKILSEGVGTYHFEATSTADYSDNFLETTVTENGNEVTKSGEVGVYFYDCGATLSDYEATLTINDEVIATSTTAAADSSTWDYLTEANATTGGRKSITLATKTDDIEIPTNSKIEIDVTVKYMKAAPIGGTDWTKNSDKSYSYNNVSKPDTLASGDDQYGSSRLKPGNLTVPYSDYLTDDQKSLVREVKLTAEVGQWQAANGYVIINYLDADKNAATTYVEGADANWTAGQATPNTVTFETPNGVTGDGFEVQTWYMNYDTSALIKFEFVLDENVPATAITVTPATATIKVGETAELKAAVTPAEATNKTVTWSSSDPAVATVSATGVVTAKKVGEATITATAEGGTDVTATAVITVAPDKLIPTVNPATVTVYKSTAAEQADEVKDAIEVSIEGLTKGTDFDYTVVVETAATASVPVVGKVTVALKGTAATAYELDKSEFTVNVKYEERAAAAFHGYSVDSTEVEVTAAEGGTLADLKADIEAKLKDQTITLKGAKNQYPDRSGKLISLYAFDGIENVKLESGTYTIEGMFDVYGLSCFDYTKDTYIPASKDITTGWSEGMGEATDTVTFTVTVTVPEDDDDNNDDNNNDDNNNDDNNNDDNNNDDNNNDDNNNDDNNNDDNNNDDNNNDDNNNNDPTTPDTPSTPSTPSSPSAPTASAALGLNPVGVNNRVGDGGSVPTDVNSGAAFTGTRAMEEVARSKPGDSINIVMIGGMNEGEIIAKIAYKKNVTVNLKYSAYTVSINSDDVSEDFEAKGFYSTARFLSAQEKAAFAGAKELRQINVKNLDGIEKATISVTMRGGSKGLDAAALNRISAGKFKTISTGKVGDDRAFSFEITKAGNYVVYAGKVDMDE